MNTESLVQKMQNSKLTLPLHRQVCSLPTSQSQTETPSFANACRSSCFITNTRSHFQKIAECIFCCSAKDKQVFEAVHSFKHLLLPRLTQRSLSQLPSDCRLNLFSGRNKQASRECRLGRRESWIRK